MLIKAKNYIINLDDFSSIDYDLSTNSIGFNINDMCYLIKFNDALDIEGYLDVIWENIVAGKPTLVISKDLIIDVSLRYYIPIDISDE